MLYFSVSEFSFSLLFLDSILHVNLFPGSLFQKMRHHNLSQYISIMYRCIVLESSHDDEEVN